MCGRYRLIDFVLSNLVNSGLLQMKVLTQYKSDSLNTHIARGWRLPAMLDFYVEVVPAQQRMGKEWFRGSADAMFQSLNIIGRGEAAGAEEFQEVEQAQRARTRASSPLTPSAQALTAMRSGASG